MPREHKIQIVERDGKIYARITWVSNGKRKALWRAGSTKTEARDRLRQALKERESLATSGRYGPQTKFRAVMDWYLSRYAVAPTYVEDRKISGLRSSDSVRALARPLNDAFGETAIGAITHSDLELHKSRRLKVKTVRKKQRSIASVHRELALARRVFNIAEREGWILRSPFRKGDPLISQSDERRGSRVMSFDEENRLLTACVGKRAHLRAVLICAVDTGMRPGELFSLRWQDVKLDMKPAQIHISALSTKTIRARPVPISERLKIELNPLWERSMRESGDKVFGVTTVRRSFRTACKLAGIEHGDPGGLTLRCLRRTAGMRWLQNGLSREEVSKLLGHTQAQTTYQHYLTADDQTLLHASEITNKIHVNQTAPRKVAR